MSLEDNLEKISDVVVPLGEKALNFLINNWKVAIFVSIGAIYLLFTNLR